MHEITWHKLWCIWNESIGKEIIIIGSNSIASDLYTKLKLLDIRVSYFIDENYSEEKFKGKYVYKLDKLNDVNKTSYYIIVTETNIIDYIKKFNDLHMELFRNYRFIHDFDLSICLDNIFRDANYNNKIIGINSYRENCNKNRNGNMFIITHKLCKFPINNFYRILKVGNSDIQISNCLKDNTNDNISEKNERYCELTGLFWIWRNIQSDYVGICHYRRYFYNEEKTDIVSKEYIEELLNDYDIILPEPMIFKSTNKKCIPENLNVLTQYQQNHFILDLLLAFNIVKEKYPDYIQAFKTAMAKKECYGFNMLIAKKTIYDDYCNWLFTILFEVEKRRKIIWEDNYQKRVFGFLSERLLNVWLERNNFRIKKLCVETQEYHTS